jgi:hypothetical protein
LDNFNNGLPLWQKIALGLGALLLTISLVSLVVVYIQYRNLKNDPNAEKNAEAKQLVAQVGKYYDLPSDEVPTIATVTDKSKVVDQPFFAKAENGDKILIYRKNKLVILFRPSQNKVINSGPVDLDAAGNSSGNSVGQTQSSVAKLGLYNASTTVGVTNDVEKALAASSYGGNISIVEKKNANSNKLGKVVVVDLSGNNKDLASKVATTVGGSVGDLPSGESKPAVDIAVYIGK